MIRIFTFLLIIFGVHAGRSHNKNSNAEYSLLDKFQQHDYNVTFERIELVSYDKRYIKMINVVTYKYNRTCPLVNASHVYNLDVGYELQITTQIYKFASNEYRTFPAHFELNFCDAVDKNVAGLADFRKCGTFRGCPLKKNKVYSTCKWAPNSAKFPPFMPNGQYMLEFQASYKSMDLFMVRCYGTVFRPVRVLK